MANKIVIIDGNSLLFRAYFATSFTGNIMRRKDGFPTNAIFAFSNMMMKILSSLNKGDSIFVSFDTGKKTFRHEKMEQYKAQRKPIEEDLKVQLPVARELLDALGVYHFEIDGYEGDDVAGTVAKIASKNNMETIVYTSDKDYLQLIDDNISIYMIKKGLSDIAIMNEASLKETMNLTPSQIKDYKGLMGDPSDNIKGIPGVGEKTAIKLINQFGSLENIIEEMKDDTSKLGEKIMENKDVGLFCKYIATIYLEVPLNFALDDLVYHGYDYSEAAKFYNKYEFYSLLKKLDSNSKKDGSTTINDDALSIEKVQISSFKEIVKPVKAFYISLTQKNYHYAKGINFYFSDGEKSYALDYNLGIKDKDLIAYLEDDSIKKATFDNKGSYCLLLSNNIHLKGVTLDLSLAGYLLNSSLESDPVVITSFFNKNILSSSSEETLSLFDDDSKYYNLVYVLSSLEDEVFAKLKEENALELYQNIELPLSSVLAKMESEGFPLNQDVLDTINEKYVKILDDLTNQIDALAGEKINLASPRQVSELLFDKLGLKANKKRSTSIEVLNELKNDHPIIPLLIEHRKYSKIISTYTTALKDYIFGDGKIHCLFNQTLTTTGRLSSSEPNLQNISVRDEEGKLIRKAFFYEEDNLSLLSLDYSQIELRLLAHMANCPSLIKAFNNDEDIHAETARLVFNIPADQPLDPALRRKAKAVNFGIVYGISDWGLSEQIGSSVVDAKLIINRFYTIFPEIKTYFDKIKEDALKNGYVTTLFNRKRYIPELQSDNYQMREFGKRASMNAPIQGTAADLIKMAMIQIDQKLDEQKLKSKLVLQIHDELIFKVYDDEKEVLFNLVKDTMENIYPLSVKLKVDGGIARTWYDCK